jgi:hypothetical protein
MVSLHCHACMAVAHAASEAIDLVWMLAYRANGIRGQVGCISAQCSTGGRLGMAPVTLLLHILSERRCIARHASWHAACCRVHL